MRLGAVGDVVRTLPAASALRAAYPHAELTWLVERASASLVEGQPWLDAVVLYPRGEIVAAFRGGQFVRAARLLRELTRTLRAGRYDLVVDFHSILKSGVLSALSGGTTRVAYARPYGREGAWLFANRRARLVPAVTARFARNAALVAFLGVDAKPAARPLHVDEAARSRMAQALGEGPSPVVMHPGTSDSTPHKRWNVDGYAAVARALHVDTETQVLVTAGPARDDVAFADGIVAAADGAARRAPATSSLAELAALFACARLYVGSDTGPMHIASLVGTPVVQLLGPTHPVENRPWEETPSRTVRVPLACSPCRRGCSAATCMQAIGAESVLAAARELLAGAGVNG